MQGWGLVCEGWWELFQVDFWGSNSTVLNLSFALSREAEGGGSGLGVHSKLSAMGNREWDMSALGAHGSLCPAEPEAGEDPALHSRDREHFRQ